MQKPITGFVLLEWHPDCVSYEMIYRSSSVKDGLADGLYRHLLERRRQSRPPAAHAGIELSGPLMIFVTSFDMTPEDTNRYHGCAHSNSHT
ncbi:hypothetical protein [Loktanella sp. M215]|uniref:hypothetical protein n=1 Tax=Loktanella sp. M215 TaxID=2675431 RepID=UPI001F3AB3FA|nr:hypothetical protein [Loktanella sp. M215]MCF7702109.1 hypothetical protein [Loktanella sp. M215]